MAFSREFWAALQTVISHSGNQLKFPSTASSKPVKIKKQKDTKQTDKLLLSKIKCWSSHSWNQNKSFCRIELKQSFFGLCLKTLLCLFKIIPKRFFYIPLCFRQDVLELPLVDTFKLASIFLFFFFLSGFSFTTIHKSQDWRGRGRAFL